MIISRAMVATMFSVLAACGAADPTVAGNDANRTEAEGREMADLPRLRARGIDYPYIRYTESTGRVESHGELFYLYPTTSTRNGLVVVGYEPGMKVEGLVTDELLGTSGLVVMDDHHVRIEFMPISLPRGAAAGQTWQMRYANRDFTCESRAAAGGEAGSGGIEVSCTAEKYVLRFQFDRQRGVTQYQDFCVRSVCTFKLDDPLGLLSKATLDYMGLPAI